MTKSRPIDPLVTPEELSGLLDEVAILDATYVMPADPLRCESDFRAAHLPGARLFRIDEIADRGASLPHMLPEAAVLAQALAALGIDGTRPVVVYDRSPNHFSAPRVWFTLRLFGLEDVRVLDGGLLRWLGEGRPVESGPPDEAPTAAPGLLFNPLRVVDGREMARIVAAGGRTILDARARDRFEGRAPEPRPGLKSGHMPGAICRPFSALTGADGRFLGPDALRDHFGPVGARPVVTCGSGMTACVLALGLERIGVQAALYDGSWAEWGQGALGPIHGG